MWLARLIEAMSALFEVALAGLGIDDSHGRKVNLALYVPQQVTFPPLRHALRSAPINKGGH
jgi:hypothetical protein